MEFLIFSAFIGFENLHNVLIAYEDKTKLITFYTHLLDTIGYVFLKNIYMYEPSRNNPPVNNPPLDKEGFENLKKRLIEAPPG